MSANLKACSNASSNGLQTIGVLGSIWPLSDSKISSISLPILWSEVVRFRVSKHTILSKQSSNPSLLRVLATWALSAFEKICHNKKQIPCLTRRKWRVSVQCKCEGQRNLQLYGKASFAEDSLEHGQASASHKVIFHEQSCKL